MMRQPPRPAYPGHTGGPPGPAAQPQQQAPPPQDTLQQHYQRKPTDRNLPDRVYEIIPEAKFYKELQAAERKLDATISRKRLDLQDSASRSMKKSQTLRVFISNTAMDQPWQTSGQLDGSTFDFDTESNASWNLRIEGRLVDNVPADAPQRPRFSSFFTSISVELETPEDVEPPTDGSNIIEWHEPQQQGANVEFDVLDIKRKGDRNTKAKILLQLKEFPNKFKLSPALSRTLAAEEDTKAGVVIAMWQYIKFHKLQDSDEKRNIKCDAALKELFGVETVQFPQIVDLLSKHLLPREPIHLDYEIKVDVENTMGEAVYDFEIEMDDPIRAEMAKVLENWYSNQNEIQEIDEQIALTVEALNASRLKRDFFQSMSENPVEFVNKWVASQARDLRIIQSIKGFNEEEVRKSDFYDDELVGQYVQYFLAQNRQRA